MPRIAVQDSYVDVPEGSTIEDAMRASGRTPDSYIYLADGRPVPMDSRPEGDVRALRVASGG